MKANELRVTNFVQFKNLVINPVIFIGYDSIELITPKGDIITAKLTEINPVPLTKDWLLKFGFDNINSPEYGIKCGSCWMSLSNPKDMGEWQAYYCWVYDRFKFIELKYVHQLQNLYFALTNEELVFG